jgi:hypothetical protein
MDHRVICRQDGASRLLPGGDKQRVERGDDEPFCSRDAAAHPSFAYAKKSQAKKHSQESSSLKEREAERR